MQQVFLCSWRHVCVFYFFNRRHQLDNMWILGCSGKRKQRMPAVMAHRRRRTPSLQRRHIYSPATPPWGPSPSLRRRRPMRRCGKWPRSRNSSARHHAPHRKKVCVQRGHLNPVCKEWFLVWCISDEKTQMDVLPVFVRDLRGTDPQSVHQSPRQLWNRPGDQGLCGILEEPPETWPGDPQTLQSFPHKHVKQEGLWAWTGITC